MATAPHLSRGVHALHTRGPYHTTGHCTALAARHSGAYAYIRTLGVFYFHLVHPSPRRQWRHRRRRRRVCVCVAVCATWRGRGVQVPPECGEPRGGRHLHHRVAHALHHPGAGHTLDSGQGVEAHGWHKPAGCALYVPTAHERWALITYFTTMLISGGFSARGKSFVTPNPASRGQVI